MLARQRTTNLRNGLDRDVYQIVRKLEDQGESKRRRLTVVTVYESIKASNSSLARQKRRPLEDAIDRVLLYRQEEVKADEAGEDSEEALERETAATTAACKAARRSERDAFLLNKQITKHWDFSGAAATPSAASAVSSPGKPIARADSAANPVSGGEGPERMDVDEPIERQPNGEPRPKRKRKTRHASSTRGSAAADLPALEANAGLKLDDMGGIDHILDAFQDQLLLPLRQGLLYADVGFTPKGGILLHGPSGTGKTSLVHALADELQVAFIPVAATSLVSGISGESERNIRDFFDEAVRLAPALLFLDDIDVVAGKMDGAQKAMEVRMSSEVSQGLDKIARCTGGGRYVVVMAASNRPDSIEPTVRRRFQEMEMSMPDERARESILRAMTRGISVAGDVDYAALARLTPGYVGADLAKAVEIAVTEAVKSRFRIKLDRTAAEAGRAGPMTPRESWKAAPGQGADAQARATGDGSDSDARTWVTFYNLKRAVAKVQPAAKREGFSTVPNTTWAEVGALQAVRRKLEFAIVRPIEQPERFAALGMKPAAGILLWGPPGCGKTLVAKAVANASKANFISIKGPELLNKYVGESEHNVRQLFSRAKSSAPCVLFFDELDALVPTRDFTMSGATSRVVNALLTELDGVNDRSGIYVVGATNRPDAIDEAIRRPGRLGTDIYVGLPTPDDRVDILRTIYDTTIPRRGDGEADGERRARAHASIDRVARDPRCGRFTGADLRQLLHAASEACLMRSIDDDGPDCGGADLHISDLDWEVALNEVKPSVKDIEKYLEIAG
ncbi:hypothetical protein GGTG_11182 [Gaeumannomyces tritici R3-111a-1]|uniref:AAA+ ATPase domain-containing protein n=1 Tax=Gaeumannomyces tritici (strain R3-111a-1) TaxID=644352 RepID=J3PCF9_GAET3|nr:hypothetical protein GGTG_11182 [Gaeumannomyces tritici R3-111a-1]EJT71929.1 hypothetical protein GGTG_11182 [Gaeumannomyces tritici R3-111a-1]